MRLRLRSELLTAVKMSHVGLQGCTYQRFGGTYYLHLQGSKMETVGLCSSETLVSTHGVSAQKTNMARCLLF
jgi:hypothetical protein